jgi:hypothetical protein
LLEEGDAIAIATTTRAESTTAPPMPARRAYRRFERI